MRVPVYGIFDAGNPREKVGAPESTVPIMESERLGWQPAGAPAPLVVQLAALVAVYRDRRASPLGQRPPRPLRSTGDAFLRELVALEGLMRGRAIP